jgi:predicted AAA+ superfamily ATPase
MTEDVEKVILDFLDAQYPNDFSIEEISEKTDIHRNTVSKYVYGLEKAGRIKNSRSVGNAKMFAAVRKEAKQFETSTKFV